MIKAKIKWYHKDDSSKKGEGKFISYQNENEVKKECERLNKKHPKINHFYNLYNQSLYGSQK